MVRLAFSNGYPLHTFYSSLLGCKEAIWNRDVDRHCASAILRVLSNHTDQSVCALESMMLSAYGGVLFEALPKVGNAPWVLPVGVFHRIRRRMGMQFCPLCLKNDSIPYYRRTWRLALYAMCERHHCIMQEFCPICRAPITYHRHGIGRRRAVPDVAILNFCHACGYDLRCSNPAYLDWPDEVSWKNYTDLLTGFQSGAWDALHVPVACGVSLFQGFHALLTAVIGRKGRRIWAQIQEDLNMENVSIRRATHDEFENLCATDRLNLLLMVTWLLDEWPERFLRVSRNAGFTRSMLSEEVESLPFWLVSVVDRNLDRRPYFINTSEIGAAVDYLISHHQVVTPQTLGSVLGLSKDSERTAWKAWVSSLNDE